MSAFTTVAPRRGFNPPVSYPDRWRPARSARRRLYPDFWPEHLPPSYQQQAPPPAPSEPAKTRVMWPQPVRDYVQRSFAVENQIAGITNKEIEAKLKTVITEVAEGNSIEQIDWEKYPLPQQFLVEERTKSSQGRPWDRQAPSSHAANYAVPATNGHISSKRKSIDDDPMDADNAPTSTIGANGFTGFASQGPNNQKRSKTAFEDRITYANQAPVSKSEKRQQKKLKELGSGTSKYQARLEMRRQRFEGQLGSPPPLQGRDDSPKVEEGPIVGTCQTLEKNFFRLTAPPKPENVRPQPVLEKTLELLKQRWKISGNYAYICDQFKSLRQDVTVQHIQNEFTVTVYEIHARIALEKGDLGEYNQCQTQLRALYMQNLGGHPTEFLAYRILYLLHTCNRADLNDVLADLTPADKDQPDVKHALSVRSALASGNYHRFFKLYHETPNMGIYLIDMFIVRERLASLAVMAKTYKFNVKIRFVTEELSFETDQETVDFLCEIDGVQDLLEQLGDGSIILQIAKAGQLQLFENAKKTAFRKVDIKGQI